MGGFYGEKIKNGAINSDTGAAWTMDDVPKFWKAKTEKWLKENA